MLKRALSIVLVSVFMMVFCAPSPSLAASPTIAIVDVEKILSDSKAAKSLQAQIQAKKEAFQKEFAAKEKELKTAETSLMAEQGKVSAEEFGKKRKAYEEKILETQKLFKKRRGSLDEGLSKSMQALRKSIVEATADVAQEKKYDIILTRESVLIAEKGLDITAEVLSKLDAKVSNIPLTIE